MAYDMSSSSGWRNRRRAADARRDEREDEGRAEIRRIRAAMAEAEADANEAAFAAQKTALEAERCACPACAGTGRVTVEVAAGLLDAWYRYRFHDYKPSQATVAALAAIARGDAPPPGSPVISATYGFVVPSPEMVRHAEPSQPVAEIVETPKPAKPNKGSKPSDNQFLADGALIEL